MPSSSAATLAATPQETRDAGHREARPAPAAASRARTAPRAFRPGRRVRAPPRRRYAMLQSRPDAPPPDQAPRRYRPAPAPPLVLPIFGGRITDPGSGRSSAIRSPPPSPASRSPSCRCRSYAAGRARRAGTAAEPAGTGGQHWVCNPLTVVPCTWVPTGWAPGCWPTLRSPSPSR
jgi:hypothetical protein